jgi:hypothetical protein
MIPDIGLMIAAYTITRFSNMLSGEETSLATKVLAVLGMIITAIAVVDLLARPMSAGLR